MWDISVSNLLKTIRQWTPSMHTTYCTICRCKTKLTSQQTENHCTSACHIFKSVGHSHFLLTSATLKTACNKINEHKKCKAAAGREVGEGTDILFLNHDSSILRQSSNRVFGSWKSQASSPGPNSTGSIYRASL